MKIEVSATINASAAAIWKVFGEEFADISKWNDAILKSSIDRDVAKGAVRTCQLKSGPVTEEITLFDPKSTALTYAITSGLPSFMGKVVNAWKIKAVGEKRSQVTSTITVNMKWYALPMAPLIKMNLRKLVQGAIDQLGTAAQAVDANR